MNIEDQPSSSGSLSRRTFLNGILPVVVGATGLPAMAGEANRDLKTGQVSNENNFPGLITRERQPVNLEFPFPTLSTRITPNNLFFVRTHFPIPQIEVSEWELSIEGEVNTAFKINYEQLRKLPSKTVMATIECAGNSRSFLVPKAKGLLWEQGGIGNAEWTGVPLSVLLDKAGIKQGTLEIILEGADRGEVTEEPKSPGAINFARSLSLTKARQPEVLIAYKMNGKDLSPEHGYPVRAIIPGYFGMSSVKWLKRIVATSKMYDGYWQTLEYAYWKRQSDLPTLTPVGSTQVKSEISRPVLHEIIPAGKAYRIFGAAWTGESEIVKVEVSTDGGTSWQLAILLDKAIPFVWRFWEFVWNVPTIPGRRKILSRATDKLGNVQPEKHDPDRRSYMVNFIEAIEVEIE